MARAFDVGCKLELMVEDPTMAVLVIRAEYDGVNTAVVTTAAPIPDALRELVIAGAVGMGCKIDVGAVVGTGTDDAPALEKANDKL
jgi:hypothetical protein